MLHKKSLRALLHKPDKKEEEIVFLIKYFEHDVQSMGKISLNGYTGGNVDPSNCSFVHKFEHIFLYYFIFVSVTQALEHYTDIFDIKRAIVHTHLLNPEVIRYPIF